MSKLIDLTGQKFGRLTVIERIPNAKSRTKWLCFCDCGNCKEVTTHELRNGDTQSCGCLARELLGERVTTHGLSHERLYKIWSNMKTRCYNSNRVTYKHYGGRGIYVCDRWRDDFECFYEDMIGTYSDGLTLDRIDVNGPYSPENCRWISIGEQSRNKRTNIKVEWEGEVITLSELIRITGIPSKTVYDRYHSGKSIDEIVYQGDLRKHCG